MLLIVVLGAVVVVVVVVAKHVLVPLLNFGVNLLCGSVVVLVVLVVAVVDSKSNKCALLLILLVQPLTTVPFDDRHGICVLISCRCSPNRGMTSVCSCAG